MAWWHFHTAIHLSLKMVLLLHKTALVNFPMATTVYVIREPSKIGQIFNIYMLEIPALLENLT